MYCDHYQYNYRYCLSYVHCPYRVPTLSGMPHKTESNRAKFIRNHILKRHDLAASFNHHVSQ